MQKTITASLSKNSFGKVADYFEKYKKALEQSVNNSILKTTLFLYETIVANCNNNGIINHTNEIKWSYDEKTNTGKVYTNDNVIIFNEMGTGITGSNNPHPNPSKEFSSWKYDVNNHGEKGWYYPKEDGTFGWTKGLPSRHMFYDAFNTIRPLLKENIAIEITKTTEDLYVK